MRRFRLHPQDLLRRRWKSVHPFRRHVTKRRRCAWIAALLFLSLLIGAYAYVADPVRLRAMAQSYLSSVLSGRVRIGQARLSIFQGLTLENVRVFTASENQPDALIFSARTLRLNYELGALISGQIRATQIIATQPLIRLVQNVDAQTWNYQHLMRPSQKRSTTHPSAGPPELPQIILRDGEIENAQVHNGQYTPLGAVWFEGRLGPAEADGRYTFTIQTRPGDASGVGPQIAGWFDSADGRAQVALRDFRFGPEMRAMLPEQVRVWCAAHQLAGALSIDNLYFAPRPGGGKPVFDVHMHVNGVNLALSPDQWRSGAENDAVDQLRDDLHTLQALGVDGTDSDSLVGAMTRFTHSPPLHLHITQGSLHFSDNAGIQIDKLVGQLEGSPFAIEGSIADYSPESAFELRLSTPEVLNLPPHLNYIRSLPVALQEVYDQFKPAGTCTFDMHLRRGIPDGDVAVTGQVDIINGRFVFDHFAYPLHNVHGQMLISNDPATGQEKLVIQDIQGQGVTGTPNANSFVHFSAVVGPFNRHCEAHIQISGKQISSDPYVIAAMPKETQKALKLFDAPGHGEYPRFHGNFLCIVTRSLQTKYHWDIDTHLDVDNCAGRLVAFPYPVENLAMQLEVRDHYLDIINAHMQKGQARLRLDGRVSWNSEKEDGSGVSMKPVLTVQAQNVPVDDDLVAALPSDRAHWVTAAGLGGKIDLDGKVYPNAVGDVAFDFAVHLHDGLLLRGADGSHAFDSMTADAHLTDTTFEASHVTARRGQATATGDLMVSWATKDPTVHLTAAAQNLMMDESLRRLLPEQAQRAWDQIHPSGTLDAEAEYRSPDSLKMTLHPRQLAVTPPAMPWRLDQLGGSLVYNNGQVILNHITAHHGPTTLAVSGDGSTNDGGKWQLHLSGHAVAIDENFLQVAPKPLADLITALSLKGKFDFDFSKLHVRDTSRPDHSSSDIDFAMTLATQNASVDVGLPMSKIAGACNVSGSFTDGSLSDLHGDFNFDSLAIADRSATNLSFKLEKLAGQSLVTLTDLDATIADGSLAGQMSFNVGANVSDHYTLSLVLRDADITQLDPDPKNGIQGQLSASVDLEGSWSDPSTRIGRGDVLVTGEHLYKIPILLGVEQITNLALPLNEPFTQGTAQYAVQGQNVIFSSIVLKAANMHMDGSGQMDFASKKFDLTFTTNNPKWPKLPIINDLIVAAQQQLLQIHVTGTIQEPKVSAGLLSAVSTTIDHVIGKP
jgi:hypothetical protein